MNATIAEIVQRVLLWRHSPERIGTRTLQRWAAALRDEVQPQLDELEGLKATAPPSTRRRRLPERAHR